jgi:hypothetical protein
VAQHPDVPVTANGQRREQQAEAALADWLAELPAFAAGIDERTDPATRRVLLDDALGEEDLLDAAPHAHPVLRARAHVALGTLRLLRAKDDDDTERGLDHLDDAVDVTLSLEAPGPRLRLLAQAGAMAALGGAAARHTRRRQLGRRLPELAEHLAEAFAEQRRLADRGTATLAAAQALAEGAAAVTPRARAAVRARAAELARDAHRDLVRAAELAKADVAAATLRSLLK